MNRVEKNAGSIVLFVLILLVITIGGYFGIKKITNKDTNQDNNTQNIEVKSIKKDDSKDFVYFINEKELSEKKELKYKDIVININSEDASKLEKELNDKMASIKNNVTKINEVDIDTSNMIIDDDIYEAEMIDYTIATSTDYLSITVNNYTYNLKEEATNAKLSFYVFDLSTGKLLTNRDILNKENKTDQDMRARIREYIKNDEGVDIDATLNQEYKLSISDSGKIIINTIVKTSSLDYSVAIDYK